MNPASDTTCSTRLALPDRWGHTRPARFMKLPTGDDWFLDQDVMSRALAQGQLLERDELTLAQRLLQPGMTVLDVGAHRGLFAMLAARAVGPEGKVIAFEPSPRECHYLRVHRRINRYAQITLIPEAVAACPGRMSLHLCLSGESGCNSLRPPVVEDATACVSVPVTTLDQTLLRLGLSDVDLVKMDIEGAERDALRGAGRLLAHHPRPIFLMEVSDLRTAPWGYRAVELYDMLAQHRFCWCKILPGGRLTPCPRQHAFHENLLAVPQESLARVHALWDASPPDPPLPLAMNMNATSTDNPDLPPVVVPPNPAGGPPPAPVNLFGDRHIEWSWIAAHIPPGPGRALEFGPGESWLGMVAVHKGFHVTAIDLQPVNWPYVEPNLQFLRGDLLQTDPPGAPFDLVMNCSVIEHVGLAGRYGVQIQENDGDLNAMARLKQLMKPGAIMLLTIPVGRDAVFAPLCRVYGPARLPRLLEGFTVEQQAYWIKNPTNHWVRCQRQIALDFPADARDTDWRRNIYALGCYVLRL